jgi:hypothetical protein
MIPIDTGCCDDEGRILMADDEATFRPRRPNIATRYTVDTAIDANEGDYAIAPRSFAGSPTDAGNELTRATSGARQRCCSHHRDGFPRCDQPASSTPVAAYLVKPVHFPTC